MIKKLSLRNFKNFREATVHLGPFTTLVGANASGKSNLRDALRFLNGVARGYSLADTFGEKYVEGALQWRGLRGGKSGAAYHNERRFALEVVLQIQNRNRAQEATYRIEVDTGHSSGSRPRVRSERLWCGGKTVFDTELVPQEEKGESSEYLWAATPDVEEDDERNTASEASTSAYSDSAPVLTQFADNSGEGGKAEGAARAVIRKLRSMRFLDLAPSVLRKPSQPGQAELGDRGENLSSVLQALCDDPARREVLIEWVRELTPMDVVDVKFPTDLSEKTLVTLVEKDGQTVPAHSASDGTLRFLGYLAALLGSKTPSLYFFEELENGLHPTRLDLLLQLIEQNASSESAQILATTHSPALLRLLSDSARQNASLLYRLEGQPDAHIRRIVEIPEAHRILKERDLARLFESGWMETSMAFAQNDEEEAVAQ